LRKRRLTKQFGGYGLIKMQDVMACPFSFFAAPERIKVEMLDMFDDIYSGKASLEKSSHSLVVLFRREGRNYKGM